MPYDEKLAQRIREVLAEDQAPVEKKMFGGVCWLLNGNMSVGVHKDDLIVRCGPDGYEKELGRAHARPFDITGRPMKGWVMVAPTGVKKKADLRKWVGKGVTFALTLPAK